MEKRILTIVLVIVLVCSTAVSQQTTPQKLIPGAWVKNWLLCGPVILNDKKDQAIPGEHLEDFQTDYLKKAGGEQNALIRKGDVVKFKSGSARWFEFNSMDSVIDLDNAVSKRDAVLAYVYTEKKRKLLK